MRAALYTQYGEPDVLHIGEAPEPHASAGAIRIRTLAVSVNPIDWHLRAGHIQKFLPLEFPVIPGRDAAGIVDEVGDGVSGVAVGDLVFGMGGVSDTTSEYSVLTAWAHVPTAWTPEQAAAAGLASITAVRGLAPLGDLAGTTLLVEGAAGAVGSAAAAVAVSRGVRVIGTASERNHAFLREMGVVPTTYGAGLSDRVAELAPEGITAALDTAASGSLPELIQIVGDPTRVSTVADGARALELGAHSVNAVNEPEPLELAAHLGETGAYTPRIAQVLPFEKIAEAHALAENGRTNGKIVLTVGSR